MIIDFINSSLRQETVNKFFAMMMERILKASIPLYFDITPAGRIIRSFHHDIRGFDEGFIY